MKNTVYTHAVWAAVLYNYLRAHKAQPITILTEYFGKEKMVYFIDF